MDRSYAVERPHPVRLMHVPAMLLFAQAWGRVACPNVTRECNSRGFRYISNPVTQECDGGVSLDFQNMSGRLYSSLVSVARWGPSVTPRYYGRPVKRLFRIPRHLPKRSTVGSAELEISTYINQRVFHS